MGKTKKQAKPTTTGKVADASNADVSDLSSMVMSGKDQIYVNYERAKNTDAKTADAIGLHYVPEPKSFKATSKNDEDPSSIFTRLF
jgi:hypothetical protein